MTLTYINIYTHLNIFMSNYNKNYGWNNDWQWDYEWDNPPELPELEKKCKHEWREDKWFTSRVFVTCKKCGAKQEEEQ